jgi:pyruvate dehydrogenase E2 component (dihydrolipoamide acetyltransferase)
MPALLQLGFLAPTKWGRGAEPELVEGEAVRGLVTRGDGPARIRATPYARRLARDRNLLLTEIRGSGPNGRITGNDVVCYVAAEAPAPAATAQSKSAAAPAAAPVQAARATTPAPVATIPSAIAVRVDFAAAEALLARIAEVTPGVTREDFCLKAAAVAFRTVQAIGPHGAVLLIAGSRRQLLSGLADASVSAVAESRAGPESSGTAALAVSFIGRAGIRPVAAQLIDDIAARLVVGAPDKDAGADCLLSYDPARIGDDDAEGWLAAFRELVETPFRLLV